MDSLTWVALGLLFFVIVLIVYTIVVLHMLPGKIARKQDHPQASAIEVCSLMGLIIFPFWMVAMVWANFRPPPMMLPTSGWEEGGPDEEAAHSAKSGEGEKKLKVGMPERKASPEKDSRKMDT